MFDAWHPLVEVGKDEPAILLSQDACDEWLSSSLDRCCGTWGARREDLGRDEVGITAASGRPIPMTDQAAGVPISMACQVLDE
jgi:hypothetical protein